LQEGGSTPQWYLSSDSYPTKVNRFIPWTKAMIAGATVAKPDYNSHRKTAKKRKKRKLRRKKRANGSKD
jgi:hypothetical protein